MYDTTMTDEEVRRRVEQLTEAFERDHPAKSAANKFVNSLHGKRWDIARVESRADRERDRAAATLYVRYDQLSELFGDAPTDIEDFIFDRLHQIMQAVYKLGKCDAPEGRSAHEARKGSGDHMFAQLTATVGIYLDAHPELAPPKATPDYANAIRPDILEVLGLPKNSKSPSTSAIVKALRAVKRGTLQL